MANHQNKYDYYEILVHNEHQQITHGVHKEKTLQKVAINKIHKSSYVLPVDVSGFVNGFTQLVMLEEDPSYWYIITRKIDGPGLFNLDDPSLPISKNFNDLDQLKDFLNHLRAYDQLAPFYQFHLLKETNWLLKDGCIHSKELLIFDDPIEGFIDFPLVRAQANAMILKLLEALNFLEQDPISIEKITEETREFTSLDTLVDYWLTFVEHYSSIPKPVKLESLYPMPSEVATAPMAKRRLSEHAKNNSEATLENDLKVRRPVIKPAIGITLVAALICLIILIGPDLKLMLTPQTNSNQAVVTPSTKPDTTLPTVEPNTLSLDQIQFEGNNWSIDESIFYTGKESIRLELTNANPSGKMIIKPVSLSENSNVSLWLRSSQAGTVKVTVVLYDQDIQISKTESLIPLEADQTWYLVSILGTSIPQNIDKVDRLEIIWGGIPQIIWMDDLTVESYK